MAHRRKRHKISGGGGHKKFTSGSFQSVKTNEKYINRDEVNFNLKGQLLIRDREEGGEVLPGKRLMRMCTCMGLHSHDWIHHNGVTFSMKLLEWCSTFTVFSG